MKRSEETSCTFKEVANGQRSYLRKPFQRGANTKLLGISILGVSRILAHRTVPIAENDITFGAFSKLLSTCVKLVWPLRLAYGK